MNSLAHTSWNCKYHIVFAPKYRRMVFYINKRIEIGKILRKLCEWKGVKMIEAEICPDHVHMLVEIPPKISISGFMGYLNREKCDNVIGAIRGMKIQVQKQRILAQRILCRHSREK